MNILFKKCKIKQNVERGSYLFMTDNEYKNFIDNSLKKEVIVIKENTTNGTCKISYKDENNKQYEAFFYIEQIEII